MAAGAITADISMRTDPAHRVPGPGAQGTGIEHLAAVKKSINNNKNQGDNCRNIGNRR